MTESQLTTRILRALNAMPRTKAIKLHGSPYLERGTPDIVAVQDGRVYWLEVKLPGKEPTRLQRLRLSEWSRAGATCAVVRSVEDVDQLRQTGDDS